MLIYSERNNALEVSFKNDFAVKMKNFKIFRPHEKIQVMVSTLSDLLKNNICKNVI